MRIQSPEGTKRINVTAQDTFKTLYDKVIDSISMFDCCISFFSDFASKVIDTFSLSSPDSFTLYKELNKRSPIDRSSLNINFGFENFLKNQHYFNLNYLKAW